MNVEHEMKTICSPFSIGWKLLANYLKTLSHPLPSPTHKLSIEKFKLKLIKPNGWKLFTKEDKILLLRARNIKSFWNSQMLGPFSRVHLVAFQYPLMLVLYYVPRSTMQIMSLKKKRKLLIFMRFCFSLLFIHV